MWAPRSGRALSGRMFACSVLPNPNQLTTTPRKYTKSCHRQPYYQRSHRLPQNLNSARRFTGLPFQRPRRLSIEKSADLERTLAHELGVGRPEKGSIGEEEAEREVHSHVARFSIAAKRFLAEVVWVEKIEICGEPEIKPNR